MRPTPILRLHAPRAALFAAALVAATVATGVAARPVSADPSTAVVTDFSSPVGSPTNAAGFFIDLFFSQGVTGLTTSDFSFTQGACTMGLRPMGPAWYQVVLSSCADGTTVVRLASLSVVSAFDSTCASVPREYV